MKSLLAVLLLALAALAIPSGSAALPSSSRSIPIPCQTGFAGTDCGISAGSCGVGAGTRSGFDPYEYARVRCGPPTFSGCTVYADTRGNVEECLTANAASAGTVGYQCSAGMESSFCTLSAGPCHETSGHSSAGEVSHSWNSVGCSTSATGVCPATSYDDGVPGVWCENYGPGGGSAVSASASVPPCHTGFAQDWCDVNAGPCTGKVTTWTAWGDRWARMTCTVEGVVCLVEVHTDGLASEHSCGPNGAADSGSARPCTASLPPYAGFDCTVGALHCAFHIWLDLNPPNPSWDCP